ncbi:MAG: polysaccharide biosynthesis/export protein [Blastocatellia bacterium]|jgi:polysaccharide export outer membrane protein|nr:polysaccharide biosynthesis/export protein [Blastocatellia bacterium]
MKVKVSLLTIVVLLTTLALTYAQEPSKAPVQTPGVDSQGIRDYLLGPGDVLDVRVFGQSELNSVAEVDSEGNLSSLPFLDPIPAKCRTEKQVQRDIAAAYAKYLKSAQVSVRIMERKSRSPATIYGAVHQPSQMMMLRAVRLNEIISRSGGVTERASGTIQILHTEPVMCPAPGEIAEALPQDGSMVPLVIKISDLLMNKNGANPMIRPGDYVAVTEAEPVYITGSVINPTGIYMRDNLTLGLALAQVNGLKKEAKASDIVIRRVREGTNQRDIIHVDYAAIKKNQKPDILLKAYDVIEVDEASPFSSGRLAQTLLSGFTSAVSSAGSMLPMRVIY